MPVRTFSGIIKRSREYAFFRDAAVKDQIQTVSCDVQTHIICGAEGF